MNPELLFGVGVVTFLLTALAFARAGGWRQVTGSRYYGLVALALLVAAGTYAALLAAERGVLAGEFAWPIRYAGWAVTTAALAYYLGLLADANGRLRVGLVAADLGMVAAGFLAVRTGGTTRWAAYGAALLSFAVVAGLLARPVTGAAREGLDTYDALALFERLRDLAVFLWLLYVVAWVLGPGLGYVRPDDQAFLFLVLDLSAAVGFAGVVGLRARTLNDVRRARLATTPVRPE